MNTAVKKIESMIKSHPNGFTTKSLRDNKTFGVSWKTANKYINILLMNKSIILNKKIGNSNIYKVVNPLNFEEHPRSALKRKTVREKNIKKNKKVTIKQLVSTCISKMGNGRFKFSDVFIKIDEDKRLETNVKSFYSEFAKSVNRGSVIRISKNLFELPKKVKKQIISKSKFKTDEVGESIVSYIKQLQQENIDLNKKLAIATAEDYKKKSEDLNSDLRKAEQRYQDTARIVRELQLKNKNLRVDVTKYISIDGHNKLIKKWDEKVKNLSIVINKLNKIKSGGIILSSFDELKKVALQQT